MDVSAKTHGLMGCLKGEQGAGLAVNAKKFLIPCSFLPGSSFQSFACKLSRISFFRLWRFEE